MGKLKYAATLVAGTLLSPLIHIGLTLVASSFAETTRHDHTATVGFSAVLYHLVIIEYASGNKKKHDGVSIKEMALVFGLVLVESRTPGVSFLGHLSGVLSGILQVVAMNTWKQHTARRRWDRALKQEGFTSNE